jgi:hypothetical protein
MSVLSHLTLRFSTHPENLATEALAYVLDKSPVARRSMERLVAGLSGRTLDLHRFATQSVNEDQSRPDLVGIGSDGLQTLAVEVKFWAGLTEAQPVAYLAAMPAPGVVLFVAPAARLHTLWAELTRRVVNAGLAQPSAPPLVADSMSMNVGGHVMAAVSWRGLLGFVQNEVEAAAEVETAADIRQLLALCEHMDDAAFLPLSSEEMTGSTGRRVMQMGALASELTDRLVQAGLADVKALRAVGGNGYYGRYLRIRGNGALLQFSARNWAAWGASPIWLTVTGPAFEASAQVREALHGAGIRFHEQGKDNHIAIMLPIGVERDAVLLAAMGQLVAIAQALPESTSAALPDVSEPLTP